MKKAMKKLTLSKETVINLETRELVEAVGGNPSTVLTGCYTLCSCPIIR